MISATSKFLLDTHTLLWADHNTAKLSPRVRQLFETPGNTFYVSIASMWEMQIKVMLNKLALPFPVQRLIETHKKQSGIRLLPIRPKHIYNLLLLDPHHGDPFDRMLVSQAMTENISIISIDPIIKRYLATTIWD